MRPTPSEKKRRAITADDYAEIARRDFANRIQAARATLHWTGAWYYVAVAIDPLDRAGDTADLLRSVRCHLERHRRIGHWLNVNLPTYVALDIAMTVCATAGYLKAHVLRELRDRFSRGVLPDGSLAFFHSDNLTFGDAVYLSRIIAAAKSVPGVENVHVTRFQRHGHGDQGELAAGVIHLRSLEIPRLDNDPLHPEHGCFCIDMQGER